MPLGKFQTSPLRVSMVSVVSDPRIMRIIRVRVREASAPRLEDS
jgi:hypothetical protein